MELSDSVVRYSVVVPLGAVTISISVKETVTSISVVSDGEVTSNTTDPSVSMEDFDLSILKYDCVNTSRVTDSGQRQVY